MRIALLCFGIGGQGGMETVISELVQGLHASGIPVRLFLLGGSTHEEWLQGLPYQMVGSTRDRKLTRYLKYLQLPFIIRKFHPTVVIGADERAVLVGKILAKMLRLCAPVASWIHFSLRQSRRQRYLHFADFHLSISSDNFRELCRINRAGQKCYLVYNPLNLIHFATVIAPAPNVPHFVYLGRLDFSEKRTNDLLQALSLVEGPWRLSIIGDGPDGGRLKDLSHRLEMSDRITWFGWQKNPWACLHDATAVVLTSAFEGLGMALIEALAHGIPCVSSRNLGVADIISDGINGWLYPPGDIERLAAILQSIVLDEMKMPDVSALVKSVEKFASPIVVGQIVAACSHESGRGRK